MILTSGWLWVLHELPAIIFVAGCHFRPLTILPGKERDVQVGARFTEDYPRRLSCSDKYSSNICGGHGNGGYACLQVAGVTIEAARVVQESGAVPCGV
jgi:hypothetical protein